MSREVIRTLEPHQKAVCQQVAERMRAHAAKVEEAKQELVRIAQAIEPRMGEPGVKFDADKMEIYIDT